MPLVNSAIMIVPADDTQIRSWQRRHHSDIAQRFEKSMRDGTL